MRSRRMPAQRKELGKELGKQPGKQPGKQLGKSGHAVAAAPFVSPRRAALAARHTRAENRDRASVRPAARIKSRL
jgi:hypothetical protein